MGDNLARRVAAVDNIDTGPTVAQMIEQLKPQIARALPKHMDPDRMTRIALTVLRQTPALQRCTPASLLGALMTAAQLGLEPGPLGESYLVPYGDKVTFIPGYRGLVKLAWQSGLLKNIDAHVVHEGDEFDYAYGLEPYLRHKPTRGESGKPSDVYAVATLQNGGSAFVVMSIADVEKVRKRSRASGSGPWVTDWDEMAKKTALRRLIKLLPMSVEMQHVNTAAQVDGSVRTDITAPIEEVDWIDADSDDAEVDD